MENFQPSTPRSPFRITLKETKNFNDIRVTLSFDMSYAVPLAICTDAKDSQSTSGEMSYN